MTAEQTRRVLGLVGLGLRARTAVVGAEQVRAAAKRGTLFAALVAADASPNSLAKVVPLLSARRVRMVDGFTADQLGAASGRQGTAAIGIIDRSLADGIIGVVNSGPKRPA